MKKILVIQLKQIGDVYLTLALCATLKKTFPQAQIHYAVYDYTAGIVENNPHIDRIISVTPSRKKGSALQFLKLLWKMKDEKYDATVNVLGKIEGALITLACMAKIRVAFHKRGWNLLHNRIIRESMAPITGSANTIDGRVFLASALCQSPVYDRNPEIHLHETEVQNMRLKMVEAGLDFSRPIFALGITSRRFFRVWPWENFKIVIEHLIEKHRGQIVLFYAPNEKETIDRAAATFGSGNIYSSNVFKNIVTQNIRELACLLKNCTLFVGNDSGPVHICRGIGTPSFALFAPTGDKKAFALHRSEKWDSIDLQEVLGLDDDSYRVYAQNIKRGENCQDYFRKITPEIVVERVDTLLKRF